MFPLHDPTGQRESTWHEANAASENRNHKATEVSQHIIDELAGLWRHAVIWSGRRDIGEDLVRGTYLRARDCVKQLQLGTRIDHQPLAILHSISIIELTGTRLGGHPESALLAIANTHRC